jgi:uncharacterized protein (TIGR03437 family)
VTGLPVTVTVSTNNGGSWLSTSGGISTSGVIQVGADPEGLAAGTYTGTIILTSPGYAPATISVTLHVASAPTFVVQPATLEFAYQQGTTATLAQALTVSSSSTAFPFSTGAAQGAPWLNVTGGGTTPAGVSVSVNPSGLAPGSYNGSVIITSSQTSNGTFTIPVHLTVTAGLVISAQPASLNFTYTQQGTTPAPVSLSISSTAITRNVVDFTPTVSPAESWLTVAGSGPTPSALQVSVDPDGLAPGVYNASIVINAPGTANTPLVVPVSLTVKAAPSLTPSQSAFTFSYQLMGNSPSNQILMVSGDPTLIVTASATTDTGSWLSVMGGGNTPAIFSLSVNPAGLAAGTYTGTITLDAQNAGNSPLIIPVTLLVASAPVLQAAPAILSFSYKIGDPNPTATSLQVASSGTPLSYQVSGATIAGGPWLQVSSGGTTTGTVSASVNPAGLVSGTYTGTISLTSSAAGNSPLQIPVTLEVSTTTTLSAAPTAVMFAAQQGSTSAQQQTVHLNSGNTLVAVTYDQSPGAPWLSVTGPPQTPGDLTISVSAATLAAGRYSAMVLVTSQFASNSPLSIPVTLDVSTAAVLSTSPPSLQYSYTIGGAKPAKQSFAVASSGSPLNFTASVAPGAPWVFASGSGTTPGSVSVTADPGTMTAGVYTGTVVVSSSVAGTNDVAVPIILTVSSAPTLSAEPSSANFSYQLGGAPPLVRSFNVSTSDGSVVPIAAIASTAAGNWLTVTVIQGSTPASFIVTVDPTGLAAGSYNGQVQFSAPGTGVAPLTLPVNFVVSSAPTILTTQGRLLFSSQTGASPPPNQQVGLFASDASSIPLSVTVSNGFSAIAATLNSTTTPATLTVSASPGSLSPGTYQSSIVVSSAAAGNSPLVLPVTLTIASQALLTASPATALFTYEIGGAVPAPISIAVNSSGTPLNFTVSASGGTWLSVAGGGTTPSNLQISVNPAGLAAGIYNAAVAIASPAAGNNPLTIFINLIVSASSLLTATPASLSFVEPSPVLSGSQVISVGSTGAPLAFSTSVSPSTPWLSASVGGTTPLAVQVSTDATGLSPGTYQGAVILTAASGQSPPIRVPVTLGVVSALHLQATPATVEFSYKPGGAIPPPQTVSLQLGNQTAPNPAPVVAPGSPWLSATSGPGGTVVISTNPTGLLPGTYTGTVIIMTNGAANSPYSIPVSITVAPIPDFDISQDSVAFTVLQPQTTPVSATINLTTGSNPPVAFQLDVTASTWFTVTPMSGTTPATVTVKADPTGLRPGNYSGSIAFYSSGKKLRTVGVNLTVTATPALSTSPPFLVFNYSSGGNSPAPTNLYVGRFDAALAVTATPSDPWILVNPSGPTTSGPIAVTVLPTGLGTGVYHGFIALSIVSGMPGTPPPAKQIPVTLYVNQPANPQIDSVLSGMSFLSSGLAPGMIFTIFGRGLGPAAPVGGTIQADQTLAQTLGGVEVLVNGIPSPLLYVSDTQVNAIAPFALYTKNSAVVTVRNRGLISQEVPVNVSAAVPGLFANPPIGYGPGAILNQDQSVNTHANPAAKGTVVSLFAGGDGQALPQGIDGLISSVDPTQVTHPILPVSVVIGGVPATEVLYAGGAPGLTAGALQVNVRIPTSVASGDIPVVLMVGSTPSQSGMTLTVK